MLASGRGLAGLAHRPVAASGSRQARADSLRAGPSILLGQGSLRSQAEAAAPRAQLEAPYPLLPVKWAWPTGVKTLPSYAERKTRVNACAKSG